MKCSNCKKDKDEKLFIRFDKQYKTCNDCFKKCKKEGCDKRARSPTDFCKAHGGGKRCQEKGCDKSAISPTDFCVAHGGGKRCQEKGCDKSARSPTDFCKAHGGGKRCQEKGCDKSARSPTDFCVEHGGGKRCQEKGCDKSARSPTDFCIEHGGGKRCQEKGCDKSAQSPTDFCVEHGGGKRCPNCIDWIDSQCGSNKYDGYCARCFKRKFPDDERSLKIYEKTYEIQVRNFLNKNYKGFIHDKPLYTGNCKCIHRRKIDHRKLLGDTILAIETDENCHIGYDENDEEIRYDDLYMIHSGKWIFIRFNPNRFYYIGKIKDNPSMDYRLKILEKEIEKQLSRIDNRENTELVEIIKLFY
jgi:hypothetical protein